MSAPVTKLDLITLLLHSALCAALAIFVPIWLLISLPVPATRMFLYRYLDLRPNTPGGCWKSVYDSPKMPKPTPAASQYQAEVLLDGLAYTDTSFDYRGSLLQVGRYLNPDWVDRDFLQATMLRTGFHGINFPFLRVQKLHGRYYHVFPLTSSQGRLTRVSRLPKGWYGAGELNPNFYSESALRNVVLSLHMGDYSKLLTMARRLCPFTVPANMLRFLTSAGIEHPPPHSPVHPHPVHYALHSAALNYVATVLRGRWFAVALRQSSQDYLSRCGASPPVGSFNPVLEGKDIRRYWNDPKVGRTNGHVESTAPVWFLDDVLHHLTPNVVGSWFDRNPHLQYLFCTAVIPPETCFGLPSLWPDLYQLNIRIALIVAGSLSTQYHWEGDVKMLDYIPEGDIGGMYTQPYSACRWLRTSRIITPGDHCLHVSLLNSSFAHHVFVISRPQLLPQHTRTLDMAPVTIVPWYVHPFGSLYQRLTSPNLFSTTTLYGVRVSDTNIRDLHSKVATHQAEVYGKFPMSYVRAATLYSKWLREMDYHTSTSFVRYLLQNLTFLTRLPFVPVQHQFQSYTSAMFQTHADVPHVWQIRTSTWVSQAQPSPHEGDCCPNDVGVFQLEAFAEPLSKYAMVSAKLAVIVLYKISGVLLWNSACHILHAVAPTWSVLSYALDIHLSSTPWGILLAAIPYWYGIRGPAVPMPNISGPTKRLCKYLFAQLYFLPYSRSSFRTGLSWQYITTLNFCLLTVGFPHLHPVLFVLDRYYRTGAPVFGPDPLESMPHFGSPLANSTFNVSGIPGLTGPSSNRTLLGYTDVPLTHIVGQGQVKFWQYFLNGVLLYATFIMSAGFNYNHHRRQYAPIHSDVDHIQIGPFSMDIPTPPPPPPPVDDDSMSPSPLPSPLSSSDPSVVWSRPPSPPPLPPSRPITPPRAPTPRPGTPVIPPQVPGDPLRVYNLPPRAIETFDNWVNLITRMAVPPNQLDPGQSCLWDVLSETLGVRSEYLWACYVSTIDPMARGPFMLGSVPHEHLVRVLTFFAVPYSIRGSTGLAANCPRGPGNQQPPAEFDVAVPALHEDTGLPGWPHLAAYLQRNPDGSYHITTRGTPGAQMAFDPPDRGDTIGWPSRLVPPIEVGEVLNLPSKVFATSYRRLAGTLQNLLSPYPNAPRLNNVVLPLVPVQRQSFLYTPTAHDASLACDLAADIKSDPSSMKLHEFGAIDIARTLDQMAKTWHRQVTLGGISMHQPVTFHLYHGMAGTGKTFALTRDLAANHALNPYNPANLAFHTWSHDLRNSFKNDIMRALPTVGLQTSNFMTGCMPLAQPRSGTVVFDDVGTSWNSFIPLFLAANPGITDVYMTFDVCQAQGSFPSSPSISRKHPSTAQWLSPMSSYYATQGWRLADDVQDLFGIPRAPHQPGRRPTRGQVITVSKSPADVPLLAVSPRFTQTQNMGGQVADTFTESQGHTIHGDVCIDLGGLTATSTDHAAWTALTRATGNIYLQLGTVQISHNLVESTWSKSQILSSLLAVAAVHRSPYITAQVDVDQLVKSAVLSHMARCLSPAAAATLGLPAPTPVVGVRPYVSSQYRTPWLNNINPANDPYTAKTYRATQRGFVTSPSAAFSRHTARVVNNSGPVANMVRHFTTLANDAVLHSPTTQYQLPGDPVITVMPDPVDDINEPTDDVAREISLPNCNATFQHIPDGAPDALHHTRADKLTDALGMAKRIRIGEHNRHFTRSDHLRLDQLKRGFKKFFDVHGWNETPFNPHLMEKCNSEKLASWASKRTKRTIYQSLAKQTLDAAYNFVKLFPKGQYIKKKPKWRSHAFPSQTVSDFNLGRIWRDSPYALYVETMILQYAYPSTYLHCRASPDDVSSWYKQHWKQGRMTGNDYTAWDSGVDHVFIEFDCWLMNLCHFPEEYIQRFREDRYTTHSFLGNHMPRQESGDRWTWLLNTARNAALTGASLDCPRQTPICVSGDDSCTLGAWRRPSNFRPSDWIMTPKREEGTRMEFCGLIFGGTDISFDPDVVHWRSRFGLQQGRSDADFWRSIRDAIVECSAKLGTEHTKLASAKANLHRAVDWFGLPPTLLLPEAPPVPAHPFDTMLGWLGSLILLPIRFLLFL
uniref:RdRp n=1 Tax=Sesame deltaflexivirus 1 TaxID=2794418 RepID=A0A7T5UG69_9VIRU|nr:RdRp [Sesame deltaflexivirus 1]